MNWRRKTIFSNTLEILKKIKEAKKVVTKK